MSLESDSVWADPYSHRDDVELILRHTQRKAIDVLDIGASHGFLLKALSGETTGRISALDVVSYSGLKAALRGEFISGLLEDDHLSWSGNPYDVVTAFDVFEHFYRPRQALAQLHRFLKPGGLLVLETGDARSGWPVRYGVSHWWYASWFVHHLFWKEESLLRIARDAGFEPLTILRRKHKSRRQMTTKSWIKEAAKVSLYRSSPAIYRGISTLADTSGIQPYSPWTIDHMMMVLKKNSE